MARYARPARCRPLNAGRTRDAQRGVALMLVMWVIALLVIMAVGITADQRTATSLAANQIDSARFRALSDAAINYAVLKMTEAAPLQEDPAPASDEAEPGAWIPDGSPNIWRFAGEELTVSVVNEGSLIDLNQASKELLSALLTALSLPADEVDALSDAVLDWRDADDLHLLNGAEDGDYAAAGRPYGAKDAPFDSVEELQQVLGFDRELYLWLAPVLTVSTGAAQDASELAPPLVQAALQGLSLEEVERRIDEQAELDPLGTVRTVNRGGPLYRVRVSRSRPDGGGGQQAMEALVELNPAGDTPFRVMWRDLSPPPPPPAPQVDGEQS